MVRHKRRVDREHVELALPGGRCDPAEHVGWFLARVDELQRVAEHAQKPGAAASRRRPDPDNPRLELLIVEGKAGGGGVGAPVLPLTSELHSEARSLASSDSSRRA